MADVEIVVEEPDVGLNANTARLERREEGDRTPVVIVRVTPDRTDIFGDVRRPMRRVLTQAVVWVSPAVRYAVDIIGEEGDGNSAGNSNELDNAAVMRLARCLETANDPVGRKSDGTHSMTKNASREDNQQREKHLGLARSFLNLWGEMGG